MSTAKKILLCPLLTAVFFIPLFIGVLPLAWNQAFILAGVAFALLFLFSSGKTKIGNLWLVLLSISLSLTVVDLALRPAMKHIFHFRNKDISPKIFAPMPSLARFDKNVSVKREIYGNLAAMTLRKDFRQPRTVVFRTDKLGFRNDPEISDRKIDLLLLGDSFVAAAGTTQPASWGSIFSEKYGLNTYSMGTLGNPWTELMDFKLENSRLPLDSNTLLLWAFFAGNDLDGPYGPLEPTLGDASYRLWASFMIFRSDSAIRLMIENLQYVQKQRIHGDDPRILSRPFAERAMLFNRDDISNDAWTLADLENTPLNRERLEVIFSEMKKISDAKKMKVAIVVIPTKSSVYAWLLRGAAPWSSDKSSSAFATLIQDLSQKNNFSYLDLKPWLIDESRRVFDASRDSLWWHDDTHWNDAGHRAAADIVYEKLVAPAANIGKTTP